ncbi:MAG: hypothetical protein CM1200mP20_07230 [Pseudomonadota bacterium]|nr:MAG: hypothetical protein CM1200mP20_07230 [Pseudomonadota bacterium]
MMSPSDQPERCGDQPDLQGVDLTGGKNILMGVPEKHPGYTHVALAVGSINRTLKALKESKIALSPGPGTFGRRVMPLCLFVILIAT